MVLDAARIEQDISRAWFKSQLWIVSRLRVMQGRDMKRLIGVTAVIAVFSVASPTAIVRASSALSSMFGVYVYPARGQADQTQQGNDESICYKSARSKTWRRSGKLAAQLRRHLRRFTRVALFAVLREVLQGARQSARLPAMRVRGLRSVRLPVQSLDEGAKTRLTTPSNITRKPTPKRSGRRA